MKAEKQKDVLFKYIEKNKDYVVEVLDRLIRANTVNPPGNEIEAARVVSDELDKLNLPYEIYERGGWESQYTHQTRRGVSVPHVDISS
jgi:acetylornithine deacetylase/succinyl-diaminopimelate desuccinylase-like protein